MKAEGKSELKLGEGEWRVKKGDLQYAAWDTDKQHGYFLLDKPTKISGQGCGMTTLVEVGLRIKGNKSDGSLRLKS